MNQSTNATGEASKYWAFISYSSKDKRWGSWLHRRLENYPIPKEFQGKELFDGAVLGKNLRPIFRDRDELAGSSNLGPAILRALKQSRYLIVLCSKNSAKSKWVDKEITDFKALHPENEKRILALILNGEPNAATRPEVDDNDECFPPSLRYPSEPLAGDLRKEGDGKERGFLKVLSGLSQIGFDSLHKRHERARKRRQLIVSLTTTCIIALLAGLSIYAFDQKRIAEEETKNANTQKNRANKKSKEVIRHLNTIRTNVDFLNYEFRDIAEKHIPLKERKIVIKHVTAMVNSLKEEGKAPELDLIRKATYLQNRADGITLKNRPSKKEIESALPLYEKALSIHKLLLKNNPGKLEFIRNTVVARTKYSKTLLQLGQNEKAEELFKKSIETAKKLRADNPQDSELTRDIACLHHDLAKCYFQQSKYAKALKTSQQGLHVTHSVYGESYRLLRDRHLLKSIIGTSYLNLEMYDRAHHFYKESLTDLVKSQTIHGQSLELRLDKYTLYGQLGFSALLLDSKDRIQISIEWYEKQLQCATRILNIDSENSEFIYGIAVAHYNLFGRYLQAGESKKTTRKHHLNKSIFWFEEYLKRNPKNSSVVDIISKLKKILEEAYR